MKRFCLECGTEAKPSDLVCIECGTHLPKKEQVQVVETAVNNKKTMTKKNKVLSILSLFFIALVVGLYTFGNSYASAESTLKRFQEAVFDKNKDALKQLVEFEGGVQLSEGELDAVITYAEINPNEFTKSIGQWGHVSETYLFAYKQSGKVFGIFDGYKIIVPNQFVSVPYPYEGLVYTLNGEEKKVKVENEQAIIGPVAPGIYELNAEYKGEFAEFSQAKTIELLEPYGDLVIESLEFDISNVAFDLDYSNGVDPSKAKLVIGDKEIAFDKEGTISSFGPFPLNGSIKVKVVSEFPWGEIATEDIEVKESHVSLNINGINKVVEKKLVDTVLAYGEQYIASRASGKTNDMTAVTNEWKKIMQDSFDSERKNNDYFSGQLDEIQADFERTKVINGNDSLRVVVPVSFSLQSVLDDNGKATELSSEVQSCSIEFVYVKDEWKVAKCEGSWFNEEAGGTIVEASKKLHKASDVTKVEEKAKVDKKEDVATKDETVTISKANHQELESFMQGYNQSSVTAINQNDFSKVSYLIVSGSPREKEQKDYLGYLNSKGITEDHLGTTLVSFKSIDDTTVEVTTKETFNLHYPDKESVEKTFTTVSQLKLVDGKWLMYKLISTK